jgi:beta-1,4-mannosyl-glycoprotein beta-1,4-N-acetylglucosaminyltransferase
MMVDAILMDNEWDCLEIRLREYRGLIDHLVIVEGTLTHQGEPREMLDQIRLRSLCADYETSLIHVVQVLPEEAPDSEYGPSVMRAIYQRNGLLHGFKDLPGSAMILISDVDEIVRRSDLEKAIDLMWRGHQRIAFEMDLFYYRMNLRDEVERWFGPRMIRLEVLGYPHDLRRHYRCPDDHVLERSGWHFSWLGSTEHQLEKLRRFSHPELNRPEIANRDFLETCRRIRMTVHNGHLLERIPVDETFPLLVQEQRARFKDLIEP